MSTRNKDSIRRVDGSNFSDTRALWTKRSILDRVIGSSVIANYRDMLSLDFNAMNLFRSDREKEEVLHCSIHESVSDQGFWINP